MRVLIVNPVYPPELVFSAQTSAQITAAVLGRSELVTVITAFPNRPAGRIYPGYHRRLYKREIAASGYKIIRCYSSLSPNSTLISRLLENLTFGLTSSLVVLFSKKPDVIYANTWPIFAQGITCFVARLRRIPIVLSIQDIYPESLTAQGRISESNLIFRILHWIDRINTRMANSIIVISERFAAIYTVDRHIPTENVHVIPNWATAEDYQLLPKNPCREKYNIPEDAFILVYAGNIGAAAGVETLIQAMGDLPGNSRIKLLIAGEGSNLNNCQELARQIKNENIIFHSPWLIEETSFILNIADILVLPTIGNQSLVSVPSKLITYLFAGKPILALAKEDTDIADVIRQTGCGWIVEPDHPKKVAEMIQNLQSFSQQEFDNMGSEGRKYAMEHFSREKNVRKVIDILDKAMETK